jgi:DNA-binding MarR family transcriptional regulator
MIAPMRRFPQDDLNRSNAAMTASDQDRIIAAMEELKRFFTALHARNGSADWVDLNLTMAQFKALMLIVRSGGAHGRELATLLGMSPSNVSTIIDHLVERRLVYREEDAIDRRITHNRPTAEGRTLMEGLMAAREGEMKTLLNRMTSDELALVAGAFAALRRVAEEISAEQRLAVAAPADRAATSTTA